jgi:hypothetical protein
VEPIPFSSDKKMLNALSPALSKVINRQPIFGMATATGRDIKKGHNIVMYYLSFRIDPTKFLVGEYAKQELD